MVGELEAHARKLLACFDARLVTADSLAPDFVPAPHGDLYHVDASHTYYGVASDLKKCLVASKEDSVIAVHDYNVASVARAVHAVAKDCGLSVVCIPNQWGDALLTKAQPPHWIHALGGHVARSSVGPRTQDHANERPSR